MKRKVYKVTALVFADDDMNSKAVAVNLECGDFANDCLHPVVMDVECVEVDWTDDHPLNKRATMKQEFNRLFNPPYRKDL